MTLDNPVHSLSRPTDTPYRVLQWTTETLGPRTLAAIIADPRLTLAGIYTANPNQCGHDAGLFGGLGRPIRLYATDNIDELIDLDIDCALYTPAHDNPEHMWRLLAAGINIITASPLMHHPASMPPGLCARLESASWFGRASLYSTGSRPDLYTEVTPTTLASVQHHGHSITIEEYVDLSRNPRHGRTAHSMGFGRSDPHFDARLLSRAHASIGPSLRLLAESIDLPLDHIEAIGEVAMATAPLADGTIAPGTVAAQRVTLHGMRGGRPRLSFRTTWYCGTDLDTEWPLAPTGRRAIMDDAVAPQTHHRLPPAVEYSATISSQYLADRMVDAIPKVCSAPPGIRTTLELLGIGQPEV